MDIHSKITEALRQFKTEAKRPQILSGQVTKVNILNRTCSVLLFQQNIVIENVKLQATPVTGEGQNPKKGFLIIPKVNTDVIVGMLDEDTEGVILRCDEIASFNVTNDTTSLFAILTEIQSILSKIGTTTPVQGTALGSTNPAISVGADKLKTKIESLISNV